ncbi:hypothetical protein T440DRAFT_99182 [Plenodomus tracheiphilus IPT5]|uniref:Zn(2)-C6 fungal-type domain-containing protein n=1 Tax=Plenodomus tracheiphilus IPT5 TaxID=1408161 RepID=A0A6A7BLF4_9PLEO|nr:hypothetical protein T440DRAFT_99182 [Plenodomus tracheiphilus IPT5]
MKLACQRCKHKKIKCDKGEPICHQCITAKADCHYLERRKRLRLVHQKAAVHQLTNRLEALEKQLHVGNERVLPSSCTPSYDARSKASPSSASIPSPEASLMVADGQESWIYQLATHTKRNFENQASPVATPTPRIDNAMSSLNDALEDLGELRVRKSTADVDLNLSLAEARACMESFIYLMQVMVIPDVFALTIDVKLLMTLPDIIDSPYVSIEPGVRVMYYTALYYGLQHRHGPGDTVTGKAYMKVLDSIPAWLDASTDSMLDGHTAALTTWTCMNNHDYQLSWKFHCKSCQFLKNKGIDELDTVPAKTSDEEDRRDGLRFLYWHVLSTDSLFRLFYGKPTVLRWSPNKVRPPALLRAGNLHPSRWTITIAVVWVRYTHLTAETINWIDNNAPHKDIDALVHKVDALCSKLEEIMEEWGLEQIVNAPDTADDFRCLVADHIMNINAVIIGMQRIIMKEQPGRTVDAITVRAARKVIRIVLEFNTNPNLTSRTQTIFDHFITFYPFTAAFSLYEHILACTEPDDCEDDIKVLEAVGAAMSEACRRRSNLVPFSRTINALNKVSRTLQDERRKDRSTDDQGRSHRSPSVSMTLPLTTFDTFQNLMASELPDFDASAFSSVPDLNMNLDGDFHPHGFVRALENDFIGRNWRGDWWDLGGSAGSGLDMMPENGELQPSQYNLPGLADP